MLSRALAAGNGLNVAQRADLALGTLADTAASMQAAASATLHSVDSWRSWSALSASATADAPRGETWRGGVRWKKGSRAEAAAGRARPELVARFHSAHPPLFPASCNRVPVLRRGASGGARRPRVAAAMAVCMSLAAAKELSSGAGHNCVVLSAGAVQCWGWNAHGQVGDGSTTSRFQPMAVSLSGGFAIALASGSQFNVVLMTDGSLKAFGSNEHGQLGDGTSTTRLAPVDVGAVGGFVTAVGAGHAHACAVLSSGSAKCWGNNVSGQLGDGTTTSRSGPVSVEGLSEVATVTGGLEHTCATTAAGKVRCWGSNSKGQLGASPAALASSLAPVAVQAGGSVASVTCGREHTCALRADLQLVCWGSNERGQLGDGTTTSRGAPAPVPLVVPPAGGGGGGVATTAVAVEACRGLSTLAIVADGHVVLGWGANDHGQLGDGSTVDRLSPVSVAGLAGKAVALGCGDAHACVLLSDARVQCFGEGSEGALGDGSATAVQASPVVAQGLLAAATAAALGQGHSCAVLADGAVQCWGRNAEGQLGTSGGADRWDPAGASGLEGLVALSVATGDRHTCVALYGGAVHCWGENAAGQLGDGTTVSRATPSAVAGLASGAVSVVAGAAFSCAVLGDSSVHCWGANAAGQLGDSTTVSRAAPAAVVGLGGGAREVAAGFEFACALLWEGSVECWGANGRGQLGDGSTVSRGVPAAISISTTGVPVAVAAGGEHACVLYSSGNVFCWGANDQGQVCDGTTTDRSAPVSVAEPGGSVRAVAAGGAATYMVLIGAGSVKGCGRNVDGQLGDGTATSPRNTPVSLTAVAGHVQALAAGLAHACVLYADGRIACWGANGHGQVGDGSDATRLAPKHLTAFRPAMRPCAPGSARGMLPYGTCADCSTGSVVFADRTECFGCSVGTFATPEDRVACVQPDECGDGHFADPNGSQCRPCAEDEFVAADRLSCLADPADCGPALVPHETSRVCAPCPGALVAALDHADCINATDCGDGVAAVEAQCIRCEGDTPFAQSDRSACVARAACAPGHVGNATNGNCEPCEPHLFASLAHDACWAWPAACGPGAFGNDSADQCEQCPFDAPFARWDGAACASAADCGVGVVGNASSGRCDACPNATLATVWHDDCVGSARTCGPGIAGDEQARQCVPCVGPEALFVTVAGTACVSAEDCGAGYIGNVTVCPGDDCDDLTYMSAQLGTGACEPCDQDEFANLAHTACVASCGTGAVGDEATRQCVPEILPSPSRTPSPLPSPSSSPSPSVSPTPSAGQTPTPTPAAAAAQRVAVVRMPLSQAEGPQRPWLAMAEAAVARGAARDEREVLLRFGFSESALAAMAARGVEAVQARIEGGGRGALRVADRRFGQAAEDGCNAVATVQRDSARALDALLASLGAIVVDPAAAAAGCGSALRRRMQQGDAEALRVVVETLVAPTVAAPRLRLELELALAVFEAASASAPPLLVGRTELASVGGQRYSAALGLARGGGLFALGTSLWLDEEEEEGGGGLGKGWGELRPFESVELVAATSEGRVVALHVALVAGGDDDAASVELRADASETLRAGVSAAATSGSAARLLAEATSAGFDAGLFPLPGTHSPLASQILANATASPGARCAFLTLSAAAAAGAGDGAGLRDGDAARLLQRAVVLRGAFGSAATGATVVLVGRVQRRGAVGGPAVWSNAFVVQATLRAFEPLPAVANATVARTSQPVASDVSEWLLRPNETAPLWLSGPGSLRLERDVSVASGDAVAEVAIRLRASPQAGLLPDWADAAASTAEASGAEWLTLGGDVGVAAGVGPLPDADREPAWERLAAIRAHLRAAWQLDVQWDAAAWTLAVTPLAPAPAMSDDRAAAVIQSAVYVHAAALPRGVAGLRVVEVTLATAAGRRSRPVWYPVVLRDLAASNGSVALLRPGGGGGVAYVAGESPPVRPVARDSVALAADPLLLHSLALWAPASTWRPEQDVLHLRSLPAALVAEAWNATQGAEGLAAVGLGAEEEGAVAAAIVLRGPATPEAFVAALDEIFFRNRFAEDADPLTIPTPGTRTLFLLACTDGQRNSSCSPPRAAPLPVTVLVGGAPPQPLLAPAVAATAPFSPLGAALSVAFLAPTDQSGTVQPCSRVLETDDGALGSAAVCMWDTAGTVLTVQLGAGATVEPGDVLVVREGVVRARGAGAADATVGRTEVLVVAAPPGAALAPPRVHLRGPQAVGRCDPDLRLDASSSPSWGGRPLRFTWALVAATGALDAPRLADLAAAIAAHNANSSSSSSSAALVLPQRLLEPGATYWFDVSGRTFLGATGSWAAQSGAAHAVRVQESAVPRVVLSAGSVVQLPRSQPLRVSAVGALPDRLCAAGSEQAELEYRWSPTGHGVMELVEGEGAGAKLRRLEHWAEAAAGEAADARMLLVPAGRMRAGYTYTFFLTVALRVPGAARAASQANATLTVHVARGPLVADIAGGVERLVRVDAMDVDAAGEGEAELVEGSWSSDPDMLRVQGEEGEAWEPLDRAALEYEQTWGWACAVAPGGEDCSDLLRSAAGSNGSAVSVARSDLRARAWASGTRLVLSLTVQTSLRTVLGQVSVARKFARAQTALRLASGPVAEVRMVRVGLGGAERVASGGGWLGTIVDPKRPLPLRAACSADADADAWEFEWRVRDGALPTEEEEGGEAAAAAAAAEQAARIARSALDSTWDGPGIVIRAGVLTAGATYELQVVARDPTDRARSGSAVFGVVANASPSGGTLRAEPAASGATNGSSLGTVFRLSADGWTDDHPPLAYSFYASRNASFGADPEALVAWSEEDVAQGAQPLGGRTAAPVVETVLDAGLLGGEVAVFVVVRDRLGAQSVARATVALGPAPVADAAALVQHVRGAAADALVAGDGAQALFLSQLVADWLSHVAATDWLQVLDVVERGATLCAADDLVTNLVASVVRTAAGAVAALEELADGGSEERFLALSAVESVVARRAAQAQRAALGAYYRSDATSTAPATEVGATGADVARATAAEDPWLGESALPDHVADAVVAALLQLARASVRHEGNGTQVGSDGDALARVVAHVATAVLADAVPGSNPKAFLRSDDGAACDALALSLARMGARQLNGSALATTNGSDADSCAPSGVQLPTSDARWAGNGTGSVDVRVVGWPSLRRRPVNGSTSLLASAHDLAVAEAASASVSRTVSVTLVRALATDAMRVRDLASPVLVRIPLVAGNASRDLSANPEWAAWNGTSLRTAACVFWNETSGAFSAAGCALVRVTGGVAECACSHLTDFEARMEVLVLENSAIVSTRPATLEQEPGLYVLMGSLLGASLLLCCVLGAVDEAQHRRFIRELLKDPEIRFVRELTELEGELFRLRGDATSGADRDACQRRCLRCLCCCVPRAGVHEASPLVEVQKELVETYMGVTKSSLALDDSPLRRLRSLRSMRSMRLAKSFRVQPSDARGAVSAASASASSASASASSSVPTVFEEADEREDPCWRTAVLCPTVLDLWFTQMLFQHPYVSLFTRFDYREDRLTRLVALLSVIFTALAVQAFLFAAQNPDRFRPDSLSLQSTVAFAVISALLQGLPLALLGGVVATAQDAVFRIRYFPLWRELAIRKVMELRSARRLATLRLSFLRAAHADGPLATLRDRQLAWMHQVLRLADDGDAAKGDAAKGDAANGDAAKGGDAANGAPVDRQGGHGDRQGGHGDQQGHGDRQGGHGERVNQHAAHLDQQSQVNQHDSQVDQQAPVVVAASVGASGASEESGMDGILRVPSKRAVSVRAMRIEDLSLEADGELGQSAASEASDDAALPLLQSEETKAEAAVRAPSTTRDDRPASAASESGAMGPPAPDDEATAPRAADAAPRDLLALGNELVEGERWEWGVAGAVVSCDVRQCFGCWARRRSAAALLSYPADAQDPLDVFSAEDEELAGWQDAPTCCVSSCPACVRFVSRHPDQKLRVLRTWRAAHGRPYGRCHVRQAQDSIGAVEADDEAAWARRGDARRAMRAAGVAGEGPLVALRRLLCGCSCRVRRVALDVAAEGDDERDREGRAKDGAGGAGGAEGASNAARQLAHLLDDREMQTIMDETLRFRPSGAWWERVAAGAPLLVPLAYLAPLLYYLVQFGSFHGSAVTLELQRAFWISQATAAFLVHPLAQLGLTYAAVVLLPPWTAAFGWIPGCARRAAAARRLRTNVLSGRMEHCAFVQAAGAASGLEPARALLAYTVAGAVGALMMRSSAIPHAHDVLQEALAREFVARRFRAVVRKVGTHDAHRILHAVRANVRQDILLGNTPPPPDFVA